MKRLFQILFLVFATSIYAQVNELSWADSLYDRGDINLVLVKLDSLYNEEPNNVDVIIKLGDSYYQLNMLTDADYFYKKALAINPNSIRSLLGIARVDFIDGNIDSAKILLDKVISLSPNLFTPYSILGKIYFMQNDFERSKYYFHKSLQVDSTNVESLTNLGLIFQTVGNKILAEKYLKEAVKFNPKNQVALMNLGVYYGTIGRNHEAIINLNHALKIDPTNPKVYLSIGINYLGNKIFSEAKKFFDKVLSLDNTNIDAKYYLFLINFELKSFDNAIEDGMAIARIKENYPQLHLIMSNIYFLLDQPKNAIVEAEKEVTYFPDEIEAYYLLASLYKSSNDLNNFNIMKNKILNNFGIEIQDLILDKNKVNGNFIKSFNINK